MEPIISMLDAVLNCLAWLGIVIGTAKALECLAAKFPWINEGDDWTDEEDFSWGMLWRRPDEDEE